MGNGTHFRVWAPSRKHVDIMIEGADPIPLDREDGGYFSRLLEFVGPGARYQFRLDHGDHLLPDPASRFQPDGPHGPSLVVSSEYDWKTEWPGLRLEGQVIYEMHVGTFTREGTWKAAQEFLPDLANIGITLLEIMPIAEFPGAFGWGYDGVDLFAPTRLYGTPDDFRTFIDRAHELGLGVILDVVYNHFGPDGNYLTQFSPAYFTDRYKNEWGEAINFDGDDCAGVREFFISNACYWIDEFRLDGLRLDATQEIFDSSPENILAVIGREARHSAGSRSIILIAENEPQLSRLVRPLSAGGLGLDAVWNDDFHHTACVAMTGHTEAYYTDYRGRPQEFISAIKWGFLYQGQYYSWQNKPRGTVALDLPAASFVTYIQNHDQVANSLNGRRPNDLTAPDRYRVITALFLLSPNTPMLFQGQEYGASTPFLYFADHNKDLARMVQRGRAEFLTQFPSIAPSISALASPEDRSTFEQCKLNHDGLRANEHYLALHKDLLKLRREDPVIRAQRSDWIQGAVLSAEAFALRFFGGEHGDRLLLINLGADLPLLPVPEPLLAPPGDAWETVWCSNDLRYGGSGGCLLPDSGAGILSAQTAVLMSAKPQREIIRSDKAYERPNGD